MLEDCTASIIPTGVPFETLSGSENARGSMTGTKGGSAMETRMIDDRTIAIRFFAGEALPVKAQSNTPSRRMPVSARA
jgi:hypothetical protein